MSELAQPTSPLSVRTRHKFQKMRSFCTKKCRHPHLKKPPPSLSALDNLLTVDVFYGQLISANVFVVAWRLQKIDQHKTRTRKKLHSKGADYKRANLDTCPKMTSFCVFETVFCTLEFRLGGFWTLDKRDVVSFSRKRFHALALGLGQGWG